MDTLLSLRVFCAVAESKSYVAAASRLGVSTAMASKHVMHLEGRLGTRLLNRTSRRVALTESGALYYEQAHRLIEGLGEVEAGISGAVATPSGKLRVSAPVWMANAVFAGVLADYHARFPDVLLEVDLTGRMVDLVAEGFDVALRATLTPSPGLIARPIAEVPFRLLASPSYLDRVGRPLDLQALAGRALLAYSHSFADGVVAFDTRDSRQVIHFKPVLQSGNENLLRLACLQGMGFAFLPFWLIADDLAAGRLESVLVDETAFSGKLLAVYPSRQFLSAKVRTFLDFLSTDRRLRTGGGARHASP